MHRTIPNILILLALSLTIGMFVLTGCGGGGNGDQVSGTGQEDNPLGEIPVTVTGTVSGGNNSTGAAPERLAAPLAGYIVRAKNPATGETLAGAEASTDTSGNFVLSFRIPINKDASIVLVAQAPQDPAGTTIMRAILPLSAADILTLINQYQGKPVLTIGGISPSSEELVKNVELDLGVPQGSLGKTPVTTLPAQINLEATRGNRFVLMGVNVSVGGQVTDGLGLGLLLPLSSQSTSSAGTQADSPSNNAVLNVDGTLLAFDSSATNLVAGDTNNAGDIFVKNTKTGLITRASVSSSGIQGNDDSSYPVVSNNGKYILFESDASNLVTGDTNGIRDLFVNNLVTGETVRINISSDGTEANNLSFGGAMSADGRMIVFVSLASNLVANDTNDTYDIFVHDRDSDGNSVFDEPGGTTTIRASVSSAGVQADALSLSAAISGDGRYVAFDSDATSLVENDTNDSSDVFVRDLNTGKTIRVSVASDGSQADGTSFFPSISDDGRFIAFESDAVNLIAGDTNDATDIFVHDRDADDNRLYDEPGKVATNRVSVVTGGAEADADSYIGTTGFGGNGGISADGRSIAFLSEATNLVPADTNNTTDVFIHDLRKGTTAIISKTAAGSLSNKDCTQVAISKNGKVLAFASDATNLRSDDTNAATDVFALSIP